MRFDFSPETPEAMLVDQAIAGDTAAFTALMRRHNQLLFRTARSITKNDAEAEEAVQEAYIKAWQALGQYRAESALSTWLVRIAINEALRRLRRKDLHDIPLEAAMAAFDTEALSQAHDRNPEQLMLREQVRKLVETRIDLLPEPFRLVFVLRVVEEVSGKAVAEALELPEATVRSRLFRARSLLREGLASDMDIAIGDVFAFDGTRCDRIVERVLSKLSA